MVLHREIAKFNAASTVEYSNSYKKNFTRKKHCFTLLFFQINNLIKWIKGELNNLATDEEKYLSEHVTTKNTRQNQLWQWYEKTEVLLREISHRNAFVAKMLRQATDVKLMVRLVKNVFP